MIDHAGGYIVFSVVDDHAGEELVTLWQKPYSYPTHRQGSELVTDGRHGGSQGV